MYDEIAIASDHAGFCLKEKLKNYLKNSLKLPLKDFGTDSPEAVDYPDVISKAAVAVNSGKFQKGLVICGTGIGASIVSNRYKNVRCALCYNKKIAKLSRLHNDSNMLALGARLTPFWRAKGILKIWLNTGFSNEPRHQKRIDKLKKLAMIMILIFSVNAYSSEFWHCGDFVNPKWDNCVLSDLKQIVGTDDTYDIQLDYNEYKVDEDTEMLLDFNNDKTAKLSDLTGNYSLKSIKYYLNPQVKLFNSNCAGFVFFDDTITIQTRKGQFLANETDCGSFTVEFWLMPTSLQNGSTIFRRVGTVSDEYSGIKIYFENKRLVFSFLNFFYDYANQARTLHLKEGSELAAGQWHHHAVTFNRRTGKLTKYLDGVEDYSLYATLSGRTEDTILIPHFKQFETTDAYIGGNFFGYLDEFRNSTVARSTFNTSVFVQYSGTLESKVMDTKNTGTIFKNIKYTANLSKGTEIEIKQRASDENFAFNSQLPEWSPMKAKIKGRYFQYKAIFKRKPEVDDTPVLKDIVIEYQLDMPPEIPIGLTAKPGNGSVQLQWLKNNEKDLGGYVIYYGKEPGKFENKIDVGRTTSYTIKNLENNETYFFTITAYDTADPKHESKYSKEILSSPEF